MDKVKVTSKYRLGKVTNKYLILDINFHAHFYESGLPFLHQVCKSYRQLIKENLKAAKLMSKRFLLPTVDPPPSIDFNGIAYLVLMFNNWIITSADCKLFVYEV